MTEWEKFERMVSLKSETVELRSAAELKQLSNNAFSVIDKLNVALSKYVDAKNSVREVGGLLTQAKDSLDKSKTEFFNKAKELGVAPATIDEYKLAIDAQNAISKSLSEIKGIL